MNPPYCRILPTVTYLAADNAATETTFYINVMLRRQAIYGQTKLNPEKYHKHHKEPLETSTERRIVKCMSLIHGKNITGHHVKKYWYYML